MIRELTSIGTKLDNLIHHVDKQNGRISKSEQAITKLLSVDQTIENDLKSIKARNKRIDEKTKDSNERRVDMMYTIGGKAIWFVIGAIIIAILFNAEKVQDILKFVL